MMMRRRRMTLPCCPRPQGRPRRRPPTRLVPWASRMRTRSRRRSSRSMVRRGVAGTQQQRRAPGRARGPHAHMIVIHAPVAAVPRPHHGPHQAGASQPAPATQGRTSHPRKPRSCPWLAQKRRQTRTSRALRSRSTCGPPCLPRSGCTRCGGLQGAGCWRVQRRLCRQWASPAPKQLLAASPAGAPTAHCQQRCRQLARLALTLRALCARAHADHRGDRAVCAQGRGAGGGAAARAPGRQPHLHFPHARRRVPPLLPVDRERQPPGACAARGQRGARQAVWYLCKVSLSKVSPFCLY